MSEADFTIKAGSTANLLEGTLEDADGNPVLIQGTAVAWVMTPVAGGAVKVNATATNLDDGTTPNKGKVRYAWDAADIDTPSDYYGEWRVTYVGGKVIRFPEDGYLLIRVEAALA